MKNASHPSKQRRRGAAIDPADDPRGRLVISPAVEVQPIAHTPGRHKFVVNQLRGHFPQRPGPSAA